MNTLAILALTAAYFVFKACQGEPQNKRPKPLGRIETPEQIGWLADVRAVETLKQKASSPSTSTRF